MGPIVTVFGAGIAGLSAAHELIERGFTVQVVEPTRSPDEEYQVEVGGLARNQFGRAPADPALLHAHATEKSDPAKFRRLIELVLRFRSANTQPVQPRFPVPLRISFKLDRGRYDPWLTDPWTVSNRAKLTAIGQMLKAAHATYDRLVSEAEARLSKQGPWLPEELKSAWTSWRAREVLCVEVRGHTNSDHTESQNISDSKGFAEQVLDALKRDEQFGPKLGIEFNIVGVGSAEPIGDQRDPTWRRRTNRVEFRIVERLIPGEHGYRFFPAFYRHLFDLMKRTPTLGDDGHATGETAFDRLVATSELGLALGDGRRTASIQTRRVRSMEELRRLSELLLGRLGVTPRDVARFHVRLLKFLSSSPERRALEYEDQSWWRFLGGDDERGYSLPMQRYLMDTSQALVAMNAREVDARSQGNIVSQLQLHYLQDRSDFTLNGPTSDVWLRPWKQYLKRQGVRFFIGELAKLEWKTDPDFELELLPVTTDRSGWLSPATPAPAGAERRSAVGEPSAEDVVAAKPGRGLIVVEVLDADDGDYTVRVDGRNHCYAARNCSKQAIAQAIATLLDAEPHLRARAKGASILLRPNYAVTIPHPSSGFTFYDRDDTGPPATRKLRIDVDMLDKLPSAKDKKRLAARFSQPGEAPQDATPQATTPGGNGASSCSLQVDAADWVKIGRLRATDDTFDATVTKWEVRCGREIAPKLVINSETNELTFKPPDWVINLLETDAGDECVPTALIACPYYFRVKSDGDLKPPIWIQVDNASDNLRIRDEPVPEDPAHNYLSHCEAPASFRPDFYVLALPLQKASRILWRAEAERPGRLHGCLAEILEFDRRTGRRQVTGTLVRVIRDANGRPPITHPFRDFAGVQYYFPNQVRIGKGHVYFPRAEWGLSSISQLAYWRERMAPAGPFIGQLSVDIGNFYHPAAPRNGMRLGRSAWNSTSAEIADEVWFQVRQAHDRDRAKVLTPPNFYHLDDGLRFGDKRAGTFRERARILVRPDTRGDSYTVWVNEELFQHNAGGTSEEIAKSLAGQIHEASFGSISAHVENHELDTDLREVIVQSTVLHGAALVLITGSTAGAYQLRVGERVYDYVAAQAVKHADEDDGGDPRTPKEVTEDRRKIRDGLFEAMLRDPHPAVMPVRSKATGLLLLPNGAEELPALIALNNDQHLNIVYGPTLNIRLDQCDNGLAFAEPASATIGFNETPFLINLPGQWRHRPGLFHPQELTFEETILRPGRGDRVRYRISNRRWVSAGTHMATTTQLATMESAAESGRHAVNAILRCIAARSGQEYNSQGRVFGDLAEICDPEHHELDDLEALKRLDRRLVDEGLPHVMDILKIVEAVDAMPMHGKPSHDSAANMLHLLQHLADGSNRDWGFVKQTLGDLLGQGVEGVHDALDPLGLLRELRRAPGNIGERIREFLQSVIASPVQTGANDNAGGRQP